MPPKVKNLVKGLRAVQDLELLKVFESEIAFELSNNPFQVDQLGSLGDFLVDWDSPHSKDVVLRKRCNSGEEVAVSAVLGPPPTSERGGKFPRDILMNVFIKKPTLSSMLQFNCQAFEESIDKSNFDIKTAYYLPSSSSSTCLGSSIYRGPQFSELDPDLQDSIKQYLIAKGIGENLIMFLLHYLHKREQEQYVNWLRKGKSFVSESE
ncbi:Mitochondrial acidic protein MAM33 [Senna tora]|uniref:Mitochondrial acidic protein MAM33 n=1 Tax=Senna tora TaxID=362788 RepID=A0A834T247_9FABA|nr:Mitochondrial acidic protein MAM33 [Senna tora]